MIYFVDESFQILFNQQPDKNNNTKFISGKFIPILILEANKHSDTHITYNNISIYNLLVMQ